MAEKARTRLLVGSVVALCALAAAPLAPAAGVIAPAAGTVAPAFTATKGDLKVAVTGLPAGVKATVKVYKKKTLVATLQPKVGTPAVKANLLPGTYTVRTTALTSTQGRLVPTTTSRTVTVVKNKAVTTTLAFKWGLGASRVLKVGGTTVNWAFVSTAARLTLTFTNRSKTLPLKGLTLVVPKDVVGLTAPTITVPSKPAGSWVKKVVACAATATCSYRVTLAPKTPADTTKHLSYGQTVAVVLAFTTPETVGTRAVTVIPVGAFAVDGPTPSFRVVKGETVPATPNTPIPPEDTTVVVPNSGTTLIADLPNGAYGPVSVYYEPAPCTLGITGSCLTATVDGTFSKDGVHLYGWGDTASEQPLDPASLTVTCDVADCPEVGKVTAIAAGTKHTCAIRSPGTVWCFGNNGDGQLGVSANVGDQNFAQSAPVQVPGIADAIAIATGHTHTCVARSGGSVWCWGANGFGQTGIPGSTLPDSTPRQVPGVTGATAVSAGEKQTCAVGTAGAVWCWGNNKYGQLGTSLNNTTDTDTAPQQVTGITGAFAVAAGGEHTCVAITGGSVSCFGRNDVGQLGAEGGYLQAFNANPTPQTVTAVQGATSISTGYNTTCVATTSLQARCFGDGSSGELGFTSPFTNAPGVVVTDIDGTTPLGLVRSIAPGNGQNDFFCAVLTTGSQWCWGDNTFSQFGFSGSGGDRAVQNIYLSGVASATTGMMHTCVVRTSFAPQCMGNNRWGQLGSTISNGTDTGVAFPLTVMAFDVDQRVLDYQAYRLQVSMKQPDGSFAPFGTAGPCSDIVDAANSPGMQVTGKIMLPAARTAGYCMDVWAFSRDPDTRDLTRVVLFAEDPRFTPISR